MAGYIDREVALKILTRIADCVSDSRRRAVTRGIREIASLAPANVEPVRHGRWEVDDFLSDDIQTAGKCSECGEGVSWFGRLPNYCPGCGAKMDLEPPKEGGTER